VTDRSPRAADSRLVGWFALLVVLVGTSLVAIRYSNRELDPFWNAGLRFALAAVIFAALVLLRRPSRPTVGVVLGSALYGVLGFAGFFGLLYAGLVQATAALGQTVLALGPLLTLFLAALAGLERLRWRPILGAMVSVAGIGIAFGAQAELDVPPGSVLALIGAAASFAAAGIIVKRSPPADPFVQNAVATAVAAVLLLAMSAAAGEPWRLPETVGTWVALVYLVLPGTVLIFMLFLFLLRRRRATTVAYQFILAPIVSITLGRLLLDEPVGRGSWPAPGS
jgi:drug/metabolite transporter (DMT)-like permease